jgi:PAS domain S-box-containing protein
LAFLAETRDIRVVVRRAQGNKKFLTTMASISGSHLPEAGRSPFRYLPALFVLLTGLTVTLILFFVVRDQETERFRTSFEQASDERIAAIETGIRDRLDALEYLAGFYAASHEVDRKEFKSFTQPFFEKNEGIKAFRWAPRISKTGRAAFEKAVQIETGKPFQITERNGRGELVRAGEREEYYPIFYTAPEQELAYAFGFDLLSDPQRHKFILEVRDSGKTIVTGPMKLLDPNSKDDFGVLFYRPIYKNGLPARTLEERRANILGLVGIVNRAEALVETPISKLAPARLDIRLSVGSNNTNQGLLYPSATQPWPPQHEFVRAASFQLAGRSWSVVCTPAAGFYQIGKRATSWLILMSGLSFTALLTAYVVSFIGRAAEIQQLVDERTLQLNKEVQERRRLAEEWRHGMERAQQVIDTAFDAFIGVKSDGTVFEWNRQAEVTFGWSKAEVLGRSLASIIIPSRYREAHEKGMKRFLETGEGPVLNKRIELSALHRDGHEFPVELTIWPVRVGDSYQFNAFVHDITERKRSEESARRLASIVESSKDAIVGETVDGIITSWNRGAETIYGYSESEIIGKPVATLVPSERLPELANILERQKRGEVVENFETVRLKKDGSLIEVSIAKSLIKDKAGNVTGVSAVARDITERKQLEAELNQAHKMEAIGQLAGGIAHDFNNILACMLGYAKLAMGESPPGSESRDDLEQILKAGTRGKELIEQVLAFSRQSGFQGKKVPHQLGEIIAESMKLLRPSLPSNIAIDLNISPVPPVLVDPTSIHQVIINLCLNASQAMPYGGHLLIEVQSMEASRPNVAGSQSSSGQDELAPGTYVVLSVTDTGCGIAKHILPRIFEPFFTTRKKERGTGMGLAVVYGIVQNHQGAIRVQTEEGRGTTVRIYLPISWAVPVLRPATVRLVKGGAESVLVIDDEQPLARMLSKTLTKLGYRVTVKNNSLEALELFGELPDQFDLVITDQTMPGLTGDRLAEHLRRVRPDIPIILCSGFSELLTPERLQEIQVNKLIRKPFVGDELELEVRRLLDSARAVPNNSTSKSG